MDGHPALPSTSSSSDDKNAQRRLGLYEKNSILTNSRHPPPAGRARSPWWLVGSEINFFLFSVFLLQGRSCCCVGKKLSLAESAEIVRSTWFGLVTLHCWWLKTYVEPVVVHCKSSKNKRIHEWHMIWLITYSYSLVIVNFWFWPSIMLTIKIRIQ